MRSWNPRTGEFRFTEQRKSRSRRVWLGAGLLMVALGLVFSAGQVLTQHHRNDLPWLVKRVQPAVITVMAYDAEGKVLSQGSGFFITPGGRFLTNYHVLAQAAQAEVKTAAGRRYPVQGVVAADRDWDLAVAAIVGTLTNTVLVLSAIGLLSQWGVVAPPVPWSVLLGVGVTNGIPEIVVAVLITTAVVLAWKQIETGRQGSRV